MIRLDNISKHHGHQLLFIEASMVLQKGGKVGLVGSNGAGKSTIFRMITGQFAQVQMQDAALGLLTVLAGVPRGGGLSVRIWLANSLTCGVSLGETSTTRPN